MPALKTIVLTLKDKEKVIIPISSSNGKSFNFSGLTTNNDIEAIRLEFEKSADRTYKVTNTKYGIRRQEVSKKDFEGYLKKLERKKTRD